MCVSTKHGQPFKGPAVGSSSQGHTRTGQAVCMAHLHPSMHSWASARAPRTPRALSTDVSSSRSTTTTSTNARQQEQQQAKSELLSWISGTKRGSNTTKLLRGQIEEAQVIMSRGCDTPPPPNGNPLLQVCLLFAEVAKQTDSFPKTLSRIGMHAMAQ